MATTSNAAMRKKTPFYVSVFRKQTTSLARGLNIFGFITKPLIRGDMNWLNAIKEKLADDKKHVGETFGGLVEAADSAKGRGKSFFPPNPFDSASAANRDGGCKQD